MACLTTHTKEQVLSEIKRLRTNCETMTRQRANIRRLREYLRFHGTKTRRPAPLNPINANDLWRLEQKLNYRIAETNAKIKRLQQHLTTLTQKG